MTLRGRVCPVKTPAAVLPSRFAGAGAICPNSCWKRDLHRGKIVSCRGMAVRRLHVLISFGVRSSRKVLRKRELTLGRMKPTSCVPQVQTVCRPKSNAVSRRFFLQQVSPPVECKLESHDEGSQSLEARVQVSTGQESVASGRMDLESVIRGGGEKSMLLRGRSGLAARNLLAIRSQVFQSERNQVSRSSLNHRVDHG